jgi:hypothetical protein
MSERFLTLREVYAAACGMYVRAIQDGHASIPLNEFREYILDPLGRMIRAQNHDQLADIRKNGT